ncbi:hypothetical protein I215_01818 [Galbibacter marinus]|uniref:Uncharacterized protein n=1 Tax=Galbibacter marinus TaxID=555500 RepID=K2PU85_9FLAO|nr:hypothetical protein [Galbibacter marinus]EKF56220.1 hypothetical protein I215_01818 [Galbibacter marinus]
MIYNLCNSRNEDHVDTYHEVAIIESTQLYSFNHLTPDDQIIDIISNLPDTSQAFITDLLPENIRVTGQTKIGDTGSLFPVSITFTQTPQNKSILELLQKYNNGLVVVLVKKRGSSFLYGTTDQPLIFTFDELNSNNHSTVKGYSIKINGSGYGNSKNFEDIQFNIFNRGLAFQLSEGL